MNAAIVRDLWDPRPRHVAVFRALQLGDMLCAVPALRALRAFLPAARITLVGLPWARSFVERFRHYVDDLLVFPGFPGYPEQEGDIRGLLDCLREAQKRRFDVAIQLHGSGELTNRIVALLGAGRVAGFRPRDGFPAPSPWFMPWPDSQPEIHRYLSLMAFLGVPLHGADLELPLLDEDRRSWEALTREHHLSPGHYVCIHPGARLRSRRWPAERFGEVGAALAQDGWQIVVTGSAAEAPLTSEVMSMLPRTAIDLTGRTTLGSMAMLLQQGALLVCNDTGVSHIAAAVRAPSVIVASGSDVRRWAPLDTQRHHVLWHDIACRPCAHDACPIGHPCALSIPAGQVLAQARRMLPERLSHAA
ncbi:MAG TPA: glycosyltransferase family 9 protein [Usitatibacter sp.]|nr:glycosyltransferase family 9 protein [Usitatibacter sp.]